MSNKIEIKPTKHYCIIDKFKKWWDYAMSAWIHQTMCFPDKEMAQIVLGTYKEDYPWSMAKLKIVII